MKRLLAFLLLCFMLLAGCSRAQEGQADYRQISQEEAKQKMDEEEVLVLDVREPSEYDAGHIPQAVLLPVGSITESSAAAVIPEKDTTVLVYCRSGNRSKTAAGKLADLGYTEVYEFGGINTWPYEVESAA